MPAFIVFALWLAAIIGWIANIVKLVSLIGTHYDVLMVVLRVIGIFAAPLGAIMGYIPN